ncbi:MAG TPA: hypothetical protein VH143_06150 [Kofleriaceae bacterium]|nr:hypothetical protein [Kofleriaceae bacterium]
MTDLTPTDGARFLFERASEDAAGARYSVAVYTPSATFAGNASLGYDGSVTIELTGAPAELSGPAENFAKLIARGAQKQRDDGFPPWPVRVLRWRGPGRGK